MTVHPTVHTYIHVYSANLLRHQTTRTLHCNGLNFFSHNFLNKLQALVSFSQIVLHRGSKSQV